MDQPLEYYPIHYDELESYLVGYLNGEEAGGGENDIRSVSC